jgi:hypothetical protein
MKARCQCGDLTAEIQDDAYRLVVACHCLDCQRRSGSPFGVVAYFPESNVTVTGLSYEFERPTDEGNSFTNGFCPRCGSTLYVRTNKHAMLLGITVGSFADAGFPPPVRSVYEQSRHGWVGLPQDLPRHPRGSNS